MNGTERNSFYIHYNYNFRLEISKEIFFIYSVMLAVDSYANVLFDHPYPTRIYSCAFYSNITEWCYNLCYSLQHSISFYRIFVFEYMRRVPRIGTLFHWVTLVSGANELNTNTYGWAASPQDPTSFCYSIYYYCYCYSIIIILQFDYIYLYIYIEFIIECVFYCYIFKTIILIPITYIHTRYWIVLVVWKIFLIRKNNVTTFTWTNQYEYELDLDKL